MKLNVLFEDDYILVCEKPAGVPTQTAKISEKDMVSEVNNYLYIKNKRAGKKSCPAFLIHRLDRPVRGILVFAKTKESASKLNEQIKKHTFNKRYYALVSGIVENYIEAERVYLTDYIVKDSKNNKAIICSEYDENAKKAELYYTVVGGIRPFQCENDEKLYDENTLLDIDLITGRFHQIRCQLSNIGHPIVGDEKYGGNAIMSRNAICLIAYKVSFIHPVMGKQLTFDITGIKR